MGEGGCPRIILVVIWFNTSSYLTELFCSLIISLLHSQVHLYNRQVWGIDKIQPPLRSERVLVLQRGMKSE